MSGRGPHARPPERRIAVRLAAALALTLSSLPAGAYEPAQVIDGGTIAGKVVYQGEVATRKVATTKDKEVCGQMPDQSLIVVGLDRGVQDAVVYLKDIQKGKALQKPTAGPQIDNVKCRFEPHVQVVPVGSIVIVNSDPILHNTHAFLGKQTVFNQALPTKGTRIEKPIKRPGMMRIECDVHAWMLAWVYAAEHPYYAVTKGDGTFSIPDVPPGSYTLVAWQEYTGETEVPVTVKPKARTQQIIELKKK
ncbi:MAG TPA: hypothetical protein VFR85_15745 [Anaeromyxobacteraceae bacterium]|nr:hypothetical protein [Anaeromyxobacteraceae bacterium]